MENKEDILTTAELQDIVKQALGDKKSWKLINTELRKAADGLTGFLGDHLKMAVHVNVEGEEKQIALFIKLLPLDNEKKAEFLKLGGFYTREAFMFKMLRKIAATPDPKPWCAFAYLENEKMVVMPDLALEGYSNQPADKTDDLNHALLAAVALARFHAAYANYATKRTLAQGRPYNILEEHGDILKESVFSDNPMSEAAAQVHKNFLKTFSHKYKDIEADLYPLYLEAFKLSKNYENTLNVIVHRDLWINNIMFKYENGVPTNALLVDFQVVQYAPPAFDPMLFLYMSVSHDFRKKHTETFLQHYFEAFMKNIDEATKKILDDLKYDYKAFREWCEKTRMFALVMTSMICPFGLINSKYAAEFFDDKETYEQMLTGDRIKPIAAFAKKNTEYRNRLLEFYEEFVDRYYVPNANK